MQIDTNDLINKIAKAYSLPPRTVADIVKSPFKMVREVIKGEEDKSVRLMYFGIFVPKSVYKKKK